MKDNFDTFRGKRGMDVRNINDKNVRFAMQVLACKMLRACRKDEVSTVVIATTKKCIARVPMNWATFLVNNFLQDCMEA